MEHKEEAESVWEPLHVGGAPRPLVAYGPKQAAAADGGTPSVPATSQPEDPTANDETRPRGEAAAAGATTPDPIRATLVDHPLQLAWRRFFVHFGRALWDLDLHLRLALILVACGFVLHILHTASYWCGWWRSPRWLVVALLLLGPWLYLERHHAPQRLQAWLQTLTTPAVWAQHLAAVEPATLRTLFLGVFLLPTLLEARSLVFLSHVSAAHSPSYNMLVAVLLGGTQYALWRYRALSPRACSQKALIFLYGAAFLASLWHWRSMHWPRLAGPFFSSTGVLLWKLGRQQQPEEGSDVLAFCLRQALRRTLQDVMGHVGTSVQRDELLQLALLRWLVDYWTTDPTHRASSTTPSASPSPPATATTPPSDVRQPALLTTGEASVGTRSPRSEPSLNWQDILPMLSVTADQMALEGSSLRGGQDASPGVPDSSPGYQSHASSGGTTSTPAAGDDPFQDLHSMFLNWDIDETAKPAVVILQRGIAAFPPGRKFAIFLSVARRSPAFWALLYQVGWGTHVCLSALLILVVLLAFELIRLHEWIYSCHVVTAGADETDPHMMDHADVLQRLDPMVILLSDDIHSEDSPSSLLRVWWNLLESVSALEKGLTAVRCVQTTAIAVDFADNLMSLARFGLEVHHNGWSHGLMVAMREIFVFHRRTAEPSATHQEAGYADAAFGAFHNSQRLYKHASVLSDEGQLENILLPLLGVLPVLIGHGWLWAQPEPLQAPRSTVVIEEIIEDDEDDDAASMEGRDDRYSEDLLADASTPNPVSVIERPRTLSSTSEEITTNESESQQVADVPIAADEPIQQNPKEDSSQVSTASCTRSLESSGEVDVPEDVTKPHPKDSSVLVEDRTQLIELIAQCHETGVLDEVRTQGQRVSGMKYRFLTTFLLGRQESTL
jgi:hypothetical protein